MKYGIYFGTRRFLLCGIVGSAFVLSVLWGHAQIITLTDINSVAQINTASQAGMFNWIVDGQDQLAQQWFWYRVGAAGPESSINTISAPTIVTPDARTLYTTYVNGAYSIEVDYKLTGGTAGSGTSGMNETITITNKDVLPLSFHFYQYTDFDLSGGPNSIQINKNVTTGLYNTSDQIASGITFHESLDTPGANHGQAGLFPNILNSLVDANPTTLSDVTSAGPGDTAYAFEWDITIGAHTSFVIDNLRLTIAPSPVVITNSPQSQIVPAGSNATFSVTAIGGGQLFYQWQFNGNALAGRTNTSLSLTNVQLTNAGDYLVIVTNSSGSATSAVASLVVYLPSTRPFVVTQPASQFTGVGSNASFSVVAAGPTPLKYQWLKDGNPFAGKTNASLSLTNVQLANAGGYSVIVTNTYGSATSATASLAVLTEGAGGNKPVQIIAPPVPPKPSGKTKLVFVTHGWEPGLVKPASPQWVSDMGNDIQTKVSSDWQVVPWFWVDDAWTLVPQKALNNAKSLGTQLGKEIGSRSFQQVHLIAHSAGSGLIQAIADQLMSLPNPPKIHLTFLDPYLGFFLEEKNAYGKNSDWSDSYFVEDGSGGFTTSYLKHAFNVDVSWVDPAHTAAPYFGLSGGRVALSSHGYPIDFYTQSIISTDPNWCAVGYGFPLSQEKEGVFWMNNQAYYLAGRDPVLPCSPPDAVKNPNPGIAGIEAGAVGTWVFISGVPHALSDTGASLVGNIGFALNSIWQALPLMEPGGIHPPSPPNTPAWLAVGVTVTNAVNFVQFDAGFTDTNAAQGLLTVYWNTNQVGMVDERVASTNLQTYRFTLPNTVSSGLYTLSFRLDSFDNSSTIAVTNVATGFVGVTQSITLDISLTNGVPLVRLTGPPGYNYLLQASTNLMDWTSAALMANTNGTVVFIDAAVTNYSRRFYRAVLFSSIAVAAPLLQAQMSGNNFILSWPTSAASYALETTTNLTAANSWTAVTNAPVVVNLQNTVTNQISGGSRFYRLRR